MKLLLLIAMGLSLVGCSIYQTSSHKNTVIVSETVSFLAFHWGYIYTCKTNEEGMFQNCLVNEIKDNSSNNNEKTKPQKKNLWSL